MLPERRYTLIVALLHQMRVRARDDLAEMFIRRVGAIHKRAKEELALIQARPREQMKSLVDLLARAASRCGPTAARTTYRCCGGISRRIDRCCCAWREPWHGDRPRIPNLADGIGRGVRERALHREWVLRRFFGGEAPLGPAMMVCLRLLKRHRGEDVNFTSRLPPYSRATTLL